MCRSKSEVPGGRRCFYHSFTVRISKLEATITKKEEELASLYRMKMKPAHIKRRIRELEITIAQKNSYLAQVQNRAVKLEGTTHEQEAQRTTEEIRILTDEMDDLKAVRTKARYHLQKIARLEATIAIKRDTLEQLKEDAAAEKQRIAEAEDAPAPPFTLPEDINTAVMSRMYNEDSNIPSSHHLILTPEEREWIDTNRGDMSLASFLLRRSMTAPANFTSPSVIKMLEAKPTVTRHDKSAARKQALKSGAEREVAGRKPAVDKRVRNQEVVIQGDIQGRAAIRYYQSQVADAYGLSMNQYARRRALGLDLYENDGYIGVQRGEERLRAFAAVEARAFIPNRDPETGVYTVGSPEELREHRQALDVQYQQQAYERTVEKFGREVTEAVFAPYLADLPFGSDAKTA